MDQTGRPGVALMVHWKDLKSDDQELLAKLIEGRHYESPEESLAALREQGLVEMTAGSWEATAAGRSVYVVRDERRREHPGEES
jgi:hypothetical protein